MPSPATLPNEIELFARISQGDEAAFTEVFYYYEPRIFPFILKMTGSATIAREIVQELFLTLWLKRETAATIDHPRSYLFRTAANKTATWLKKEARKAFIEKEAAALFEEEDNSAEENIDLRQVQEIVNKAVEQLPPQQKLIYKLNRQQGLKNEEIARQLHLSEKTVKNHLSEALKTIRQYLRASPGTPISLIILIMKWHS